MKSRSNAYKRTSLFRKLFVEIRQDDDPIPEAQPFAWRNGFRLGLLAALLAGGFWLASMYVNVLVLGTDDVDYSQHTDTIMLVHWKPLPKRLALLSIPRDTLIRLPKRGPMKINAVYAYGMALGNPEYALAMTRSAVENVLGMRAHFLVHVRYSDFIKLVDDLGGVPINVAEPMHYVDLAGGLNINLEPGYQLLDGRQALDYVRFRHDRDGDLGRIRRQQAFLRAFAVQLARFSKLQKTYQAFNTFLHSVETNIQPVDAAFLALEMKGLVGNRWRTAILPGQPVYVEGKSYWEPNPLAIRRMVSELGRPLTPPAKPKPAEAGKVPEPEPAVDAEAESRSEPEPATSARPEAKAAATPAPKPVLGPKSVSWPAGPQPTVRILNGCGVNGVCKGVAQSLRQRNLVVAETNVTNAPNFNFRVSIVKTNAKNLPWARRIATILGLEKRIQIVPEKHAYPTVTVVVGKDYQTLLK